MLSVKSVNKILRKKKNNRRGERPVPGADRPAGVCKEVGNHLNPDKPTIRRPGGGGRGGGGKIN